MSAPDEVFAEGHRWLRTSISSGKDLVNGRAWIAHFSSKCADAQKQAKAAGSGGGGRRLLRASASAGDEPQYWARAGELSNPERNRILDAMPPEERPGKRVVLPTGDEVIFWFNVGPTADRADIPPADRVFVTSARCPHQGVCLSGGELREIEDIAGCQRPVIRCPRHNRLFDVSTGEGQGNYDTLPRYPAKFIREYGAFYVAIHPTTAPQVAANPGLGVDSTILASATEVGDMDVDMTGEPAPKKPRSDLPAPQRRLLPQYSMT